MTTRFIGIKEFRQNLAKIARQSHKKGERLILLRRNKPMFEVRPLNEKNADIESLVLDIDGALNDIAEGRIYTHKNIKKKFGVK